jgi:D-serine deaminase-like pyridoxal phosphate-dependent protein
MYEGTTDARAPSIPSEIVAGLPTPCLIVDLAACERNIERAAAHFADTRTKLRPHFKAHKCTELLSRQLRAGSCVGVTCATAWEADILSQRGFADILVANQVVDRPGLAALGRAAGRTTVTVAVDHPDQVELLRLQAQADGVRFSVLIEIDVGMDRCGIPAHSDLLLELAQAVESAEELSLRGLQGYEGHAVLRPAREERAEQVLRAADILGGERARLLQARFPCPIISGGGTGTYDLAPDAGVLDEVQAGSYALMDARYATLDLQFENALFMLTTLISHRRPEAATINAGLKALTVEFGMPRAVHPGVEVLRLADEHAWLSVPRGTTLEIGEPIFLIPAHIDPAINLHDVLFVWDASRSRIDQWPVDGRRNEAAAAMP